MVEKEHFLSLLTYEKPLINFLFAILSRLYAIKLLWNIQGLTEKSSIGSEVRLESKEDFIHVSITLHLKLNKVNATKWGFESQNVNGYWDILTI